MSHWIKQIIDWFRNPPGQYVGYAIVIVIIFLLLSIRYGPNIGLRSQPLS